MAYQGGGLTQIWRPDLTTRVGAQSAMDSAKFCFLLVAGFRTIFYAVAAFAGGSDLAAAPEAFIVFAAVALLEIGLPLIAAWRLHVYKGAVVVPIATALYVLGILASLTVGSLIIGAIFTGVFVGGIRGAWALRRGTGFDEDYYATFN